jgi:hypothetical protein
MNQKKLDIYFPSADKTADMNAAVKMKAKILEMQDLPKSKIPQGTIAVFDELAANDVVRLAVAHGAQHVVQRTCLSFDQEIRISEIMLSEPQKFMQDPLSFILPDALGLQSFQITCAANENKKNPLLQLEMFIKSVPGSKAIVAEVIAATEELFTNASKNTGTFYRKLLASNKTARAGSVSLQARANKDTLVVGCSDSFGQLNVENLMNKLLGCFDNGLSNSIQEGDAGAGIGTYLVFNAVMNLYIAVDANKQTSVVCSYPLGMRTKNAQLLPKNLHLLSFESAKQHKKK